MFKYQWLIVVILFKMDKLNKILLTIFCVLHKREESVHVVKIVGTLALKEEKHNDHWKCNLTGIFQKVYWQA